MADRDFRKLFYYFFPPVLLISLILIVSGDLGSSPNTAIIIKKILDNFYLVTDKQIESINYYFRLMGHLFSYIFLYLLLYRALKGYFDFDATRSAFEALSLTIMVALLDEGHQSLFQSRTGKLSDIFLDLSGVSLLAFMTIIWARIAKNKQRHRDLESVNFLIAAGDFYHTQGKHEIAAQFYRNALGVAGITSLTCPPQTDPPVKLE